MVDLERKVNYWFLYRNPSPSSVEVLVGKNDWELLTADSIENERYFLDHMPTYLAGFYDGKIGHRDEFPEMLKTVKMLAKWKQAHEEKVRG